MQENRPVIALDFPEFSDVKDFSKNLTRQNNCILN